MLKLKNPDKYVFVKDGLILDLNDYIENMNFHRNTLSDLNSKTGNVSIAMKILASLSDKFPSETIGLYILVAKSVPQPPTIFEEDKERK